MIKILHVIDTGGPGGAETVFLHTSTGLNPGKFRSVCVVSRDGWLTDSLRKRGVTPLVVPASGSFNLSYLRRLARIARDERVDIIAGHLYGSAIYCSLAGRLLGIPVVSVLHGQSDIARSGRFAGMKRLLVRIGTRRLVFVSDRLKMDLAPALHLPESRCIVIPNGVDMEHFSNRRKASLREELRLREGDILVGAVGNIRGPKSYDVLLEAARILRERSPHYRFAIAGEGSGPLYDSLLALRRQLGVENEVVFLGLRSDVASILRSLDVYVLSSTTEGFSIACVEAMAAGTPVVSTRSGGPEEIIEDGQSGLLVPTQDPRALADAIERIAADPLLSSHLSTQARERVRGRYTLTAMLTAYEGLFQEVATGR
jgi:glycosyltransferase involved in cell wall biosynthesis